MHKKKFPVNENVLITPGIYCNLRYTLIKSNEESLCENLHNPYCNYSDINSIRLHEY